MTCDMQQLSETGYWPVETQAIHRFKYACPKVLVPNMPNRVCLLQRHVSASAGASGGALNNASSLSRSEEGEGHGSSRQGDTGDDGDALDADDEGRPGTLAAC